MGKLEEIQALINSLEVGDVLEPGWDGMVDVKGAAFTPLGEFVIKVERILARDDALIDDLIKRLNGLPQQKA